ncbi:MULTISPECIES: F0F1 ATP synthase subunit delta [unclassified Corynebacterium]|uniref:F0F1 ATP synthase subunit delta n=1 Tax=unclassified Corynebacterium TaxID=2624378 RepID=UPI002A918AAA|nr:F0F1 ATP synthase subunit delta [Corynebacterium sp.]MDY5786298.1 F0F1 ATP synthase subunit delta [Corynebacterium sp.]
MKAASREAQANVERELDALIRDAGNGDAADVRVATAAQIGTELFLVVDQLDKERALRVAAADSSLDATQRQGILDDVFGAKVAEPTRAVLRLVAGQEWSTPRDMRSGLIHLGRRALMLAAQEQGQLEQVESELFQLSFLLEGEKELTQLLSDRTADAKQKRSLLASVLYGKVTMFTEALALQVIGRPVHNPIDDLAAVADEVAGMRGKTVARVTAAEALDESQRETLAGKLQKIYGQDIAVHTEVDPSLLGGMVIRVGDEEIDGSTRGKLTRLRADLAASMAY